MLNLTPYLLLAAACGLLGQPDTGAEATTTAPAARAAAPAATTSTDDDPLNWNLLEEAEETTEIVKLDLSEQEMTRRDLGFIVEKEVFELVVMSDPIVVAFTVDLTLPSEQELLTQLQALKAQVTQQFKGKFYQKYHLELTRYNVCLEANRVLVNQTMELQLVIAQTRRYARPGEVLTPLLTSKCGARTSQIPVIESLEAISTLQSNVRATTSHTEALMTDDEGAEQSLDLYVLDGLIGELCDVRIQSSTILQELIQNLQNRLATISALASHKLPGDVLYEVYVDCLNQVHKEITEIGQCNGIRDGYACSITVWNRLPLYQVATLISVPIRLHGVNLQISSLTENLLVQTGTDLAVDVSDCTWVGRHITCGNSRKLVPNACLGACRSGAILALVEHCQFVETPDDQPLIIQVVGGTIVALRSPKHITVMMGKHKVGRIPVLLVHRQPLSVVENNTTWTVAGDLAVLADEIHALRLDESGLSDLFTHIYGAASWIHINVPDHLHPYVYGAVAAVVFTIAVILASACACLGYICKCHPCGLWCCLFKCCWKSARLAKHASRKRKRKKSAVRFETVEYHAPAEGEANVAIRTSSPNVGPTVHSPDPSSDSQTEESSSNPSESDEDTIRTYPVRKPR